MSNMKGLDEILSLWEQWKSNKKLPFGKGKWKTVFEQLNEIRRWGIEETLIETGMLDLWQDLLDPINPHALITFQIELFYRNRSEKRKRNEEIIRTLLGKINGRVLSDFIDIPQIAIHAVKAELPAGAVQELISQVQSSGVNTDIELFKFGGIMYFRPTGQSLSISDNNEGIAGSFQDSITDLPPIAALLDGAPLQLHTALKDKVLIHDVFKLDATSQPGERKHGTAMASLILHGDRSNPSNETLKYKLY
ncbi:hypothetical protein, partial [Aeromonas veronii]|uniref:hypothetical protein n=1 Tax=Aeromonas veronii TaxID=654 RepID=UPI003F676A34